MPVLYSPFLPPLTREKRLNTLVENRSVYTHQQSEKVHLRFDHQVFMSMFRGKKIMHLKVMDAFEYLPGESVIVPENETMNIDFPEAGLNTPAQCLGVSDDAFNSNSIISVTIYKSLKNMKDYTYLFQADAGSIV